MISNIKILVVDDDPPSLELVVRKLKQLDLTNLDTAEDGALALSKLQSDSFDLVIADWQLPGLTGLELIKSIRKDEKLRNLLFLLLTGEARSEKIQTAQEAGIDGYLLKPFSGTQFQEKIQELIPSLDPDNNI